MLALVRSHPKTNLSRKFMNLLTGFNSIYDCYHVLVDYIRDTIDKITAYVSLMKHSMWKTEVGQ